MQDTRETKGLVSYSFHIHECLLPRRRVAAAQHAGRHSSRSVSIYAIANCYHRPNFEIRALENHSPLYIRWMRNGIAIQRLCWKREDDGVLTNIPKNNGNNLRKMRYFFIPVTSSSWYLNKSIDSSIKVLFNFSCAHRKIILRITRRNNYLRMENDCDFRVQHNIHKKKFTYSLSFLYIKK